jgi:hypothetical protein
VKRRRRVSKCGPEQGEGFLARFILDEVLALQEARLEYYEILRLAQDGREGKAQDDSFRESYLTDCTLEGKFEGKKCRGQAR